MSEEVKVVRDAFMHDVPLKPMDDEEVNRVIAGNKDSEVVVAMLHLLRNKACEEDRLARQVTFGEKVDPLEYRAFHGGAAEGAEELFWRVLRRTLPDVV